MIKISININSVLFGLDLIADAYTSCMCDHISNKSEPNHSFLKYNDCHLNYCPFLFLLQYAFFKKMTKAALLIQSQYRSYRQHKYLKQNHVQGSDSSVRGPQSVLQQQAVRWDLVMWSSRSTFYCKMKEVTTILNQNTFESTLNNNFVWTLEDTSHTVWSILLLICVCADIVKMSFCQAASFIIQLVIFEGMECFDRYQGHR